MQMASTSAAPAVRPRFVWVPDLIFEDNDNTETPKTVERRVDEFVRVALDPRMDPRAVATMYRLLDLDLDLDLNGTGERPTGYGLSRTWKHPAWSGLRAEEERRNRLLEQLENLDEQVGEGTFECPACHGRRTFSQGLQTRSADEPLTYYVRCARTECPRSLKMWVVRG